MEKLTSGGGIRKEEISVGRFDLSASHEVSEDFSLPDYMPEVRRIVSCTANVLPESKYLNGSAVELSGLVIYSVLYVGDDGALSCAPLNTEYSTSIAYNADDGDEFGSGDIGVQTAIESSTCRATGPRRLSLSSRMRSRIFSVKRSPLREKISATMREGTAEVTPADEIALERRKKEIKSCYSKFTRRTGTVKGELRERDGTKVISCCGSVGVNNVQISADSITIRGDAYLSCLILTPDGTYAQSRSKMPIEESLAFDGGDKVSPDSEKLACAVARCASVNIDSEEGGLFNWEIEYDVDAELVISDSAVITDDLYSTEYNSNITYGEKEVLSCLKCTDSNLTVSASKQINGAENKTVASSYGKVSLDHTESDPSGKLTVCGNCIIYAITVGDGEALTEEISIPVRFECDCEKWDIGTPVMRCDMNILYMDSRIDGDRINVSAELGIALSAMVKKKVRLIDEVTINKSEPVGLKSNTIKVYYPIDGEDLWDIGKKYHCEKRNISSSENKAPVLIIPDTGSIS